MKKLILIAIASSSLVWGSGFEVVTHADRVDLTDHLEPGRLVLFDFYADWCGPCRQLEPHLKSIGSEYASQLVIKKVDIVNWNTPVTQQYGINSIPHLKLFDEDGNLISQGGARSHFLTAEFAIPDAPAPDEIVIVLGAATTGRPHHRIGNRYSDMEEMKAEQGA